MRNLRFVTEAWKISPSNWPTRRAALVMVFAGLVMAHGFEEAQARAIHGGIAVSGGGSVTTLTPWTVKNNTGSAYTNIPIEVPVPFAASTMTDMDSIQVLDSDGTTVLACQEDNRTSDYSSYVRITQKLTVILPSLSGNQTKQLTIQKLSGTAPVAGTDITTSEVIATGYDTVATMVYKDGNTYTASAADGLAAGTWTAKTAAANTTKWRGNGNGGFVTEWVVFCPFSRSGGTIFTTNNLGMWFCVSAYKAQRGAVTGGNPIIAVCTKYWVDCGYVQITPDTAENHWFDLTVASGTNSQSWVGSSPAKTLTLSSAGSYNETVVVTVPSGGTTFSTASIGQVITDNATGSGLINKYVSATQVEMRVRTAFTGTSIASGDWRMWGTNLQYSADFPKQEIWYGGSPTITVKPDILSHLGTAWNGTTGGPMSYFISTGMMLPYSTPVSDISHTGSINQLNLSGTNPSGFAQGYCGDMLLYMPTSGGRGEIAPVPTFQVAGLIKFDSDGQTLISGNASKLATCPVNYRDETTGKAGMAFNNGINWVRNKEYDSTVAHRLPLVSVYQWGTYPIADWTWQTAHHPNCYFAQWLLDGDYYWVEKQQQLLFCCWTECPAGSNGSQYERLYCCVDEPRGNAWNMRDTMFARFMTPDFGHVMPGYSQADIETLFENQFTTVGSGNAGSGSPNYPGLNISCVSNTGSGKAFATSGTRGIGIPKSATPTGGRASLWQLEYGIMSLFHCQGLGMHNSHMAAYMTWLMEGVTGPTTNTATVKPNWMAPVYYYDRQEPNSGAYVNTWADVYRVTANDLSQSGLNRRLVTGTGISLSAVSGSAVTFTAPTGYFDAGGTSFYTNGLIRDLNAASLQITPMAANSRAGGDPYAEQFDVGTSSGSRVLVTNAGTVKVWNTGSKTIYIKLTVGAGTATTSDTAITAGNYGKFTVGANTYLNYIAAAGASTPVAVVFGSRGSGYANGNTITVTISGVSGNFTVTTAAVLTVNDVGAAGDVVDVSISTPGIYTALALQNWAGDTLTQSATSGSGTGFTYRCNAPDLDESSPLRYGTGFITAVNSGTHVVTIDTTTSMTDCQGGTKYGYPFAQTSLTTNKILAPAPYPGDADGAAGYGGNKSVPIPYTNEEEYWTLQLNANKMANLYGYANAAAAVTYLAASYTGPQELKWRVVN